MTVIALKPHVATTTAQDAPRSDVSCLPHWRAVDTRTPAFSGPARKLDQNGEAARRRRGKNCRSTRVGPAATQLCPTSGSTLRAVFAPHPALLTILDSEAAFSKLLV